MIQIYMYVERVEGRERGGGQEGESLKNTAD